jgi:hypothetical protein
MNGLLLAIDISQRHFKKISCVEIDIFNCLLDIKELSLLDSTTTVLKGIVSLKLGGQYRFWEPVLYYGSSWFIIAVEVFLLE